MLNVRFGLFDFWFWFPRFFQCKKTVSLTKYSQCKKRHNKCLNNKFVNFKQQMCFTAPFTCNVHCAYRLDLYNTNKMPVWKPVLKSYMSMHKINIWRYIKFCYNEIIKRNDFFKCTDDYKINKSIYLTLIISWNNFYKL